VPGRNLVRAAVYFVGSDPEKFRVAPSGVTRSSNRGVW
jgi:hypothetical protein